MAIAIQEHDTTFAGESAARCEFRCRRCGYGIVVRASPPRCPMCRGNAWQRWPEMNPSKRQASTERVPSW
jgi:hypothetical protein